ncbi:MAG: tyrosine-type recombinase/integrase [Mangrovibacterium sp.]
MGATICIYLDKRVKKSDHVYPLKLRVTFERQRMYLGISKDRINPILDNSILEKFRYDGQGNYSINEDIFNKAMAAKNQSIFKDLQNVFKGIELDAQRKADKMDTFTLDGFRVLMTKKRNKQNKIFELFDEVIGDLESNDRVGTAKSYRNSATSLKEFVGTRDVAFEYFTVDRLQKYQKWMEKKGNSITTLGIYLRALRAIFNEAIGRGITHHYPFTRGKQDGKEKFQIPKGKGRKIALDSTDLKKIFEYNLTDKHPYRFYLDMWKLMFYLGGINPTDLCLLKESNIKGGFIFYSRQKTLRTSIEKKIIQVPYSDTVAAIIDKWKAPQDKNSFLLPVITPNMTALKRKAKIDQFVKMINTAMNSIAGELEITKNITTYVARHSIATQLLRTGAPVKLIGDQLGHHNTKTTEQYLEGFEDDQITEAYKQAIKF